jgi:SAM-dependent methyltransferase
MQTSDGRRLVVPSSYPYQNVVDIISPNDGMLAEEDSRHYLSVGLSALSCVSLALKARDNLAPASILDLPCGHGRVMRALKAAFPESELFGCDLDRDGVNFCADTFDATPLFSNADFKSLNFGRRFDLIWVGSLITHLPADAVMDFFRFILRHLSEEGVAVVSSHGAYVTGRIVASLLQGGEAYGVDNVSGWRMVDDFFVSGFGYADYPTTDFSVQHYGVSLASSRWVGKAVRRCGGKLCLYREHAWDRHHDVVAFARQSVEGEER